MNNEAYTSFPNEREVLLPEGCSVYVLGIEKDKVIENPNKGYTKFNGRKITVIYLLNVN